MKQDLLIFFIPFTIQLLNAQIRTFELTFESDDLNTLPTTSPENGDKPTGLFGNFENTISVQPVSVALGNSTATGNILTATIPNTNNFQ